MTSRLLVRACTTQGDKQTGSMKIGLNTLLFISFVCLNPQRVTVIWEGNDLGKLKCTGTQINSKCESCAHAPQQCSVWSIFAIYTTLLSHS